MTWNNGYVADVNYPADFYHEQAPSYLNFACVLNGVEPVPPDQPFNYCELGFGRGLTLNLLAAGNPQGRFYGVDFLPAHVAEASDMAANARLDNLTLLENSFAELADGVVPDLPQFDFITMHGVYTWVTPENRRRIVRFLTRYLKPGGVVYLSYNALPGCTSYTALQRLITEHADRHPGRSDAQMDKAREFIRKLDELHASFFPLNPGLKYRLEMIETCDIHYLAHEYLNRASEPLYYADVARELSAAKLGYIGSANLTRAFPHLYLTPERRTLLDACPDDAMRQTVLDYLFNTSFRRDIFIRGARRMTALRREELLQQTTLAAAVARGAFKADAMESLASKGTVDPKLYMEVFDALEGRPHTLAELAALPALRGPTMDQVAEIACLLTTSQQAAVCVPVHAAAMREPAQRMNRAVAMQSCYHDRYKWLVSPLLGCAVGAGLAQRLVYFALSQQPGVDNIDADAVIAMVADLIAAQGERLTADDASPEAEAAEQERTVKAILERRLPMWRQLGMI